MVPAEAIRGFGAPGHADFSVDFRLSVSGAFSGDSLWIVVGFSLDARCTGYVKITSDTSKCRMSKYHQNVSKIVSDASKCHHFQLILLRDSRRGN